MEAGQVVHKSHWKIYVSAAGMSGASLGSGGSSATTFGLGSAASLTAQHPFLALQRPCTPAISIDWAVTTLVTQTVQGKFPLEPLDQAAAVKRSEEAAAQLLQEEQAAAESAQRAKNRAAAKKDKKARYKQRQQVCTPGVLPTLDYWEFRV